MRNFATWLSVVLLLLVVGYGEHGAGGVEPFDAPRAVAALARARPPRGVRAAEAKHHVLRALERNVVRPELDRENRDVGVQEEVQRDFVDVEDERDAVVEGDANAKHVLASKHAQAALAGAARGLLAGHRAIDEALHVRQERHELLVIALADLARFDVELVALLAPRIAGAGLLERLPVALHRDAGLDRHQLERPQHDLAEMTDRGHRASLRYEGASGWPFCAMRASLTTTPPLALTLATLARDDAPVATSRNPRA